MLSIDRLDRLTVIYTKPHPPGVLHEALSSGGLTEFVRVSRVSKAAEHHSCVQEVKACAKSLRLTERTFRSRAGAHALSLTPVASLDGSHRALPAKAACVAGFPACVFLTVAQASSLLPVQFRATS